MKVFNRSNGLIFNSMFDELKEVKYFKEIKRRGVFRTQASIYDGAFLWIYLKITIFLIKALS